MFCGDENYRLLLDVRQQEAHQQQQLINNNYPSQRSNRSIGNFIDDDDDRTYAEPCNTIGESNKFPSVRSIGSKASSSHNTIVGTGKERTNSFDLTCPTDELVNNFKELLNKMKNQKGHLKATDFDLDQMAKNLDTNSSPPYPDMQFLLDRLNKLAQPIPPHQNKDKGISVQDSLFGSQPQTNSNTGKSSQVEIARRDSPIHHITPQKTSPADRDGYFIKNNEQRINKSQKRNRAGEWAAKHKDFVEKENDENIILHQKKNRSSPGKKSSNHHSDEVLGDLKTLKMEYKMKLAQESDSIHFLSDLYAERARHFPPPMYYRPVSLPITRRSVADDGYGLGYPLRPSSEPVRTDWNFKTSRQIEHDLDVRRHELLRLHSQQSNRQFL